MLNSEALEKSLSVDQLRSGYEFDLDPSCIAQEPAESRDGSRLLSVSREDAGSSDLLFTDLPDLLGPSDLIVVNDTRVIPARLRGHREHTGGRVEILLVEPRGDGTWAALVRPSAKLKQGARVRLEAAGPSDSRGAPVVVIGSQLPDGRREVRAIGWDLGELAQTFGEMPLPPYIDRSDGARSEDALRYQTLFATELGAVAAPTAGLHFSEAVLARLDERGIERASVTLHVGPGTFQPVRCDRLAEHVMHTERYQVPVATAQKIQECEARGGRVLAIGTTVCRTLESWHRMGRPHDGAMRKTSLFLRPGHSANMRLSLLTNFHLPSSTLVMLVASFLGRERTLGLYRQAAEKGYRFFSYGDAMLIL